MKRLLRMKYFSVLSAKDKLIMWDITLFVLSHNLGNCTNGLAEHWIVYSGSMLPIKMN